MFDPGEINKEAFDYYSRLGRLRIYVEENLSEPISLSDAAYVVGLEPTYFSRFFHCKTGVCFHTWLHYFRVCSAIDILKHQNHPITDLAFAVVPARIEQVRARREAGGVEEFGRALPEQSAENAEDAPERMG